MTPSAARPDPVFAAALADRYTLQEQLGEGGMATVWRARDLRHERDVALKVLKPDLAAALGTDRFLHEVRVTAALQHPHILPLFDSGETNGLPWYVMPYVTGESVRDRLRREPRLPVEEAVLIARQVASALAHAHQRGVVHRDVKPENVLLHDGHAYVADFGIALALARADTGRLTGSGFMVGTPQYMSPEQATNEAAIDGRSDQWALAAMLYEMLAGEPPHSGATWQAIVTRVVAEAPTPLRALRPGVPSALDSAVMRALHKVPADRYPSAEAFEAALGAVTTAAVPEVVGGEGHDATTSSGAGATSGSSRAARRRWPRGALAALPLAAALGIAWVGAGRLRGETGWRGAFGRTAALAIAVIPCEDRTGDTSLAYIAEGFAENLVDRLTTVSQLNVVPRGVVRAAVLAGPGLPEIARAVRASHLVTCSVTRAGNGVGIRAQLVQTTPQRELWADGGTAAPSAVLAIEDSLLQRVVASVPVRMTGEERLLLAAGETRNGEAHRLVLQGSYQWNRFSPAGLRLALGYFHQALALDSMYARAWGGIAVVHMVLGFTVGSEPLRIPMEQARNAIARGLALRPDDAGLLMLRAMISAWYDRDSTSARRDLTRAIALQPDEPNVQHVLTALGEFDAADRASLAVIRLDPVRYRSYVDRAINLFLARRFDESGRAAHEAIARDSTFASGHIWSAYAAAMHGRRAEASAAMDRAAGLAPGALQVTLDRVLVLGLLGERAEVRRLLQPLARDTMARDPALIAAAWGLAGDHERAFEWLARAEREGSRWLVTMPYDRRFDPLREDPRFEAIVRRRWVPR
jgi:TolB-like protein/tetratricopeptide (TPR) repeat protein